MPLTLICDCGARFDIDDSLSGKEVPCPECGELVHAPSQVSQARTSLWALVAVVLALTGALTFVGGIAAVLVGAYALTVIRRRPEQLAGSGFALSAIALGVVGSLVAVGLFFRPDVLPASVWVRQRALGGQVDSTGALEMISRGGDVMITRPSRDWGRARRDRTDDPVVGDIQQKADLLLVNVKRHAFVEVIRHPGITLDQYEKELEQELNPFRPPLLGDENAPGFGPGRAAWVGGGPPETGSFRLSVKRTDRNLAPVDGHNVREWEVRQTRGGQKWVFLIRAYRKSLPRANDPTFIVRAYTPLSRFKANEEELIRLLDTVRIGQ
jgi:hypothetical protein